MPPPKKANTVLIDSKLEKANMLPGITWHSRALGKA